MLVLRSITSLSGRSDRFRGLSEFSVVGLPSLGVAPGRFPIPWAEGDSMHSGFGFLSMRAFPAALLLAARLFILLFPGVLLLFGSLRSRDQTQVMLYLGGVFQVLIISFLMLSHRVHRNMGPSVIIVYLIALAWLWMGYGKAHDWYSHFAQFVLLVVPLLLFALQTLTDSGALASRRARVLAQRLARRKDWPADLRDCRTLPEVKALREALANELTPALALLQHDRPQVRVAALAALEFRKFWKPGQAEMILHLARQTTDPVMRASAVSALANLDDRALVEQVAEFLRDPSAEVRRAAAEALLWDTEHRWGWIRHGVRMALADPALHADGPLLPAGGLLKPEAVTDLTAWATEKGGLGVGAAITLSAHFSRALNEQGGSVLVRRLKQQVGNAQSPPALRIELGQLLRNNDELDQDLLFRMVDGSNPAPLRLIAADALLGDRSAKLPSQRAVAALRNIARLPNREMALTAADVVQRRLGVDLGLALGQPLPPLHSRLAADVTRRLMQWAAQQDQLLRDREEPDPLHSEKGVDETPDPTSTGGNREGHDSGLRGIGSGAGR